MKAPHWRTVAVILVGALGAAACSDDSTQPGNTAPVANFTSSCTDLVCTFTDLSSDADGTVANLAWDFGDDGSGSGAAPQHTYAAAGDYLVTLTARDNDDAETSKAQHVIVTAAVGSNPPTADFTVVCSSLDCTFTDASTPTGAAVTWDWDFGDGSAHSALQAPPVHTYVASGVATYTAKLTITDASSNSSTKSTQFTVSPAATLQCADAANPNQFASCTLKLLANATVRVTLTSRECTAHGNSFQITAPITATLFTDGCYTPAEGTSFDLNGGAQFAANTELEAQVISGSTKQEVAPALHVEGTYPTWTLRFDDGEDNTPPEPDFNDLVITVTATPAP